MARLLLLCFLFILPETAPTAVAQGKRFIPTEDWTYTYITRLQRRGHLLGLHPTALPYRADEIAAALQEMDADALRPEERRWFRLLQKEILRKAGDASEVIGASLEAGLAAATNDRLDPVRFTDRGNPTLQSGEVRFFPRASGRAWTELGPVIAQLGLRHDVYYDVDPDGLDAVKRLYIRSEESYIAYARGAVQLSMGRFNQHWGPAGEPAVMISDNPRSYDHLAFRLAGRYFSVRSILGELDSITGDGRYTGGAGDDSVASGSERRFYAAHRFDWRPSRRFGLAIMESALYSGASSGLSLKYLLPTHAFSFVVDEPPKNDENNGMLGGILWWLAGRTTLTGQLLIDDFDVVNGYEPASFALTGSITHALPRHPVDLGGRLEVVAARTYNAPQKEGQATYLLRGLGTQFSDYALATFFADCYLDRWAPGLSVSPRFDVLLQGPGDLRHPYPPADAPMMLEAPVERTLRAGARLLYQPSPLFWVSFDAGVNQIQNRDFRRGHTSTLFVGQIVLGARLRVQHPVRL